MERKPYRSKLWTALAVLVTVALAAALRLWGIEWGLPDHLHKFTYHPDEVFQVVTMLRLDPFGLQFDPGFYNYPSGYMNLGAAAVRVAQGYGLKIDSSLTGAYLVARLVTVALGALTVPFVYAASSKLYGRAAGFVAALLLAVMPLHIVHSHYATVDVAATFWVAAALLCALCILDRPTYKIYVAAGLLAGLAAGTKYNVALALLSVIAAHFVKQDGAAGWARIKEGRLWAALGAFVVGLVTASPGLILWPGKFWSGLLFELHHAATPDILFQGRGPGWFIVLTDSLGYGLGVLLLAAILFAVGLAIVRRQRSDLVMLAFIIPYFLLIVFSKTHFSRYAVPLLPPLAILTARLVIEIQSTLKEQAVPFLRLIWIAICAGVILYTSIYAVALDRLFVLPDPRDQAAAWFEQNVPSGATVGLATVPWFYSPPFAPGIIGTVEAKKRFELMSASKYKLIADPAREWSISILQDSKPRYVVISDFEYQDALRVRLPEAVRFFKYLDQNYKLSREFKNPVRIDGVALGSTSMLPHDLKYMAPTIRVYRRG